MGAAAVPIALGASSLIGAGAGLLGASKASSAQTQAAGQATQAQLGIYNMNRGALNPWIQSGAVAQDTLMRAIPSLAKPFQPTMEQLAQTPGYQFALKQGLLATQNGMAASGLGQSGPALKGAANYAEGLASTTYQNQFQNYLGQNSQIYNMLAGPGQTGLQAGAALAGVGAQTGGQIGNNIIGAGNAQGGAAIAGANAISGGINSGIQNYLQASLFSQLMGGANPGATADNSQFGANFLG